MTGNSTWFVTGASRGLGAAIAKAALAAGHNVVATARRAQTVTDALGAPENLLAVALDVTSPGQVEAAVALATERFGRVDVLVNNAGYGQLGFFEEVSLGLVRKQLETNVFGTMEVTRAVLPVLRAQRCGHVITISSTSGVSGFGGSGVYSASKFALEGWTEALQQEIAPFGIKATIVEPGYFRTDFLDATSVSYGDIILDDYQEATAELRTFLQERNHQQEGDPDKLARALLDIVASDEPPLRFAAGEDAVEVVETMLAQRKADLDAWRNVSASLSH